MKKNIKIIIVIAILIITLGFIVFEICNIYAKKNDLWLVETDNMASTMKGIVVKVNEKTLDVMGNNGKTDLYSVSYADEGNIGFKKGQEILIHFNGIVMSSFPMQIGKPGKIEIVNKDKINEIPEDIEIFYYSSHNNVNITLNELTNSGIALTIVDKNELTYTYPNTYKIYKEFINPNYPEEGKKIGEDTKNSTSGYTRNRTSVYMGRSRKNIKYFK